jgi:hypothetical protein
MQRRRLMFWEPRRNESMLAALQRALANVEAEAAKLGAHIDVHREVCDEVTDATETAR